MPVPMASMNSEAYAEEEQRCQLSKLAKRWWLELDATFNHVFLACYTVHSSPVEPSPVQSIPIKSSQVSQVCQSHALGGAVSV